MTKRNNEPVTRMLPAVVRVANEELISDDTNRVINTHPSVRLSPNALLKLSSKNSFAKPSEHSESIHATKFIVTSVQPRLKDVSYVLPPLVVQMSSIISISCCGSSPPPPLSCCMLFAAILSFRAIESVMHAISDSISDSVLLDGGVLPTIR